MYTFFLLCATELAKISSSKPTQNMLETIKSTLVVFNSGKINEKKIKCLPFQNLFNPKLESVHNVHLKLSLNQFYFDKLTYSEQISCKGITSFLSLKRNHYNTETMCNAEGNNSTCNLYQEVWRPTAAQILQHSQSKLQLGRQGEKGWVGRDGVAGLGDHLPPPPTHPRRF